MATIFRLFLAVIVLAGVQTRDSDPITYKQPAIIIPTSTPTPYSNYPPLLVTPFLQQQPTTFPSPTFTFPPRITPTFVQPATFTATFTAVPSATASLTSTPTPSPTSTSTPSATPTPSPTSTNTATLLPPEAKTLMPACTNSIAAIIGQAMVLEDVQFLSDMAPAILAGVPGEQVCGQDAECWNSLLLRTLTSRYIEAAYAAYPGPRPALQVIGAMATVFDEPAVAQACHNAGVIAWEMALQFSIKGTAIDGFALHSPANLRVRDFEGKESRFNRDGSITQDIPGSLARRDGESQHIYLPGEKTALVEFEGTASGDLDLQSLHNTGQVVRDMSFEAVPVENQTRGNLNLDSDPPLLEVQAADRGQLASIMPSDYQEFAIQASVAPATATPSVTPTSTPTSTPTPTWQALLQPEYLFGMLVICGGGLLIGIFAAILAAVLYPKKPGKPKK